MNSADLYSWLVGVSLLYFSSRSINLYWDPTILYSLFYILCKRIYLINSRDLFVKPYLTHSVDPNMIFHPCTPLLKI